MFIALIYKVAHALRVVKLRLTEATLYISDCSGTNLLNKFIRICVYDKVAIISRVWHDQKLRDAIIR